MQSSEDGSTVDSRASNFPLGTHFIHHFHDCQVDLICLRCDAIVAIATSIGQLQASQKIHVCGGNRTTVQEEIFSEKVSQHRSPLA